MAMGSDSKNKFIDTWEMIFHAGNRQLNFSKDWDDKRFDVQTHAVPQTNFTDTKYHPTQKPLELIKILVEAGSYDGDDVLDPFAGSGTTAATGLNRNFTLIEKELEHVAIINKRFGL
jgi:DNA modification methylase